jgi:hypothetical protein
MEIRIKNKHSILLSEAVLKSENSYRVKKFFFGKIN